MDNVEAKVKDLKQFLRKHGISYDRIDESTQSRLVIDDTVYISTRSSYYKKYEERGFEPIVIEMIKKYLLEISCAYDFESKSAVYEKQKTNALLEKIDKTIKNKNLEVSFTSNKSFGGYTDSRKKIVIFDPPDEPIDEYLKIAPGINYHELGHVLYTCSFKTLQKDIRRKLHEFDPNVDSYNVKQMEQVVGAILKTVNALEDGRMENLMGNKYGIAIPYFRSTIFNFLLSSIEEKVDMDERITEFDCALIAGRKYIDFEFRKWVFDKYMECDEEHTEEKAKRVNMYINKFVILSWRKNREEMLELAMGFFFEFVKPELEKQTETMSSWENQIEKMLQGIGSSLNLIDSDEDGDIDESEEKMLKKVMGDIMSEAQPGGNADGEGDGKGKGDGKESGEKGDPSGDKGGDHDGNKNKEADNKVREGISNARKEANDQVNKNSNSLKRKLKVTEIGTKQNRRFDDKDVTTSMKKNEMLLEKKLKEYMRKCRNGYQVRRRKGAVDIGEARRQSFRGGTRIFKQYKHNVQKALDIDVAFVLDCSYSMSEGYTNSKIDEASRQLWIASTACKSVGAKVKIFTFSDYDLGTIEQPKNDKVKYRCPYYVNGTVISDTLYKAESYLNASTSNTKWLISLTDGAICDKDTQDQILIRMQREGVTCGKINLVSGRYEYMDEQDSKYDYVLKMTHDGRGNINMLEGDNIVTFFKNIYEISLRKIGLE